MEDSLVDKQTLNNPTNWEPHITSPTFNQIDFQSIKVTEEINTQRLPWDMSFSQNHNEKLRVVKGDINSLKSRLKSRYIVLKEAANSQKLDIQKLISITSEIIKETLKDLLMAQ